MNENLTESTVLAMVAAKLQGMRVLSVGATQTPSGQDIIIRLERKEPRNQPVVVSPRLKAMLDDYAAPASWRKETK